MARIFQPLADGSGAVIERTTVPGPYSFSDDVVHEEVVALITAEDLGHIKEHFDAIEDHLFPPPPPAPDPVLVPPAEPEPVAVAPVAPVEPVVAESLKPSGD